MFVSLAASLAALMTSAASPIAPQPLPRQPVPVRPGAKTPAPHGPVRFPGPLNVPPRPQAIPGAKVSGSVAAPAQQMDQARKMASLFTQAQKTLDDLKTAEQKVTKQNQGPIAFAQRGQLRMAIQNALNSLRTIRGSVPYDDLQQQLYQASGTQGAVRVGANARLNPSSVQPLASAVENNKMYLAPSLVTNVQQAQSALKAGDDQRAALELKHASDTLYDDIALAPIDKAIQSLESAQAALKRNDNAKALEQLHGANQIADKLKMDGPLVPVRFELRAAAQAADANKHHEAQTLVQNAGDQLKKLRGSLDAWQFRAQLDPMIQKVANLRNALDAGQTPSGDTIRGVASQATAFKYDSSFQK